MPKSTQHYATALALMGKLVVVSKVLDRKYGNDRKRSWVEKDIKPRTGWVVGIRWKQNGEYQSGSHYGGLDEYGYDPPLLKQEGNVPALAVVFWPTENPVYVPFDGYAVADGRGVEPPHPPMYKWSERDKEEMRKIAAQTKRDALGRFTPEMVDAKR
jgi:hypothetical protein